MKKLIGPFFGGILFAIGLGVSGMTEASKIIGFLDITGDWKPELIFVMLGALVINIVLFQWIMKRKSPVFEKEFHIPQSKTIDQRLVVGAIFFGVGWGLTGLCPGPGVVSLVSGTAYVIVYVVAMLAGMVVAQHFFSKKF